MTGHGHPPAAHQITMKHTDLRKKDIAALSNTALVNLLWEITKTASETAETFGEGDDDPRDNCVLTPEEILGQIEAVALPSKFAWAGVKR